MSTVVIVDQAEAQVAAQGEEVSPRLLRHEVQDLDALGLTNLPWKAADDSPLAPMLIDIDWLVTQPLLPYLVQTIPAQTLYSSLIHHGLDDSLEVIEWIRAKQLVKILDFDLWSFDRETTNIVVAEQRALHWMRLWLAVGERFAAERFCELEEETITLVLSALCDIKLEGIDLFDAQDQDDYWTTLDGAFHVAMKNQENPGDFETVHGLISALYAIDAKHAYAILAHTALSIHNERLDDAVKWRAGRLADEGFVDWSESLQTLRFQGPETMIQHIKSSVTKSVARVALASSMDEDSELQEAIYETICHREPEFLKSEIPMLLSSQDVALLVGHEGLNEEDLVESPELYEAAAKAALSTCRTLLAQYDARTGSRSSHLLIEKTISALSDTDREVVYELKQRVARMANVAAAGFAPEKFTSDVVARASTITRGALNIGLELTLESEELSGLFSDSLNRDERAKRILVEVGPELLFQLGWQSILALAKDVIVRVVEIIPETEAEALLKVARQSLERWFLQGRFAELRHWVAALEEHISIADAVVLGSLLNRIPMYPLLFDAVPGALQATTKCRPFESTIDLMTTRSRIANFVLSFSERTVDVKMEGSLNG